MVFSGLISTQGAMNVVLCDKYQWNARMPVVIFDLPISLAVPGGSALKTSSFDNENA
jgi:hypothetical protein